MKEGPPGPQALLVSLEETAGLLTRYKLNDKSASAPDFPTFTLGPSLGPCPPGLSPFSPLLMPR